MEKLNKLNNAKFLFNSLITISFALWLFLLFSYFSKPSTGVSQSPIQSSDRCAGRYIYVQTLPSKFNSDLISACHNLSMWTDMCPFTANAGLGPPINNPDGILSETGWYNTNQFTLELIFHNRMKVYDCLTTNSSLASAIYVSFYAGLDIGRYLWGYNSSVRDASAVNLIRWLKSRPEWSRMDGRDHFFVAGRITWDFRRLSEYGDWGSTLLLMPEARNMTCLVIESSPWHSNDIGIPYPTYFHPSTKEEVVSWQERMRSLERPWLFSFAGAPRPNMTGSIRDLLIEQCRSSKRCKLLECPLGPSKCHSPSRVMKLFQSSVFCLQPQGDSYTRRSTFDSMLAGCIPVFFHPGSAYVQYVWHLPRNYTKYSVFIPEDDVREGRVTVEEVLRGFGESEVKRMREEVVRIIPTLVYNDPRVKIEGVKDAFDVAVEGVIKRVEKRRGEIEEGGFVGFEDDEHYSWRHGLVGRGEKHEWDHFFDQK